MKLMEFALGSQRKRMLKKNSRWKKSNLIISGVKIHVFKEKSTSTCVIKLSHQPQICKGHRFGLKNLENWKSSQRELDRIAKSCLYETKPSTKKIFERKILSNNNHDEFAPYITSLGLLFIIIVIAVIAAVQTNGKSLVLTSQIQPRKFRVVKVKAKA